jgi:putative transposase
MIRKRYTPTFKAQVVRELLKEEKTLAQLAAEHGVHPTQLIKWRATALEGLPSLFTRQDSTTALTADYEARLATLYEEIGRLTTQVAWLKRHSGLDPLTGGARDVRRA